ncbi:MAG: hypothetical protein HY923_03490 [Elusimicrobia bacterium]|nr:hypothetical protein [Elusimicrobiota bacterium]
MRALTRRATALLTAASIVVAAPGGSAWAQAARATAAGVHAPSIVFLPGLPASPATAPFLTLGLSVPSLIAPALLPIPAPALDAAPVLAAAAVALPVLVAPLTVAAPARMSAPPVAARPKLLAPVSAPQEAPAETQAALAAAAFDGANEKAALDEGTPAVAAVSGDGAPRLTAARRSVFSVASLPAILPLAASMPQGAYEWHLLAGTAFGAIALIYAVTGTISLLTAPIKSLFEPALPVFPEVVVEPGQFPLSPAKAAAALTEEERGALAPGMPLLRAAAGSPQRRWYEFRTTDGRTIEVHARTGRRMRSPRSPVFARGQVNRWLAGSRWKAAGPGKLITTQGEYYRKGELPHYQVDLEGPGGWQAFVSAKDGRILAVHSRLSRTLKWIGKGPHAWGIKALDKVDTLKRLLAPLLLGLPILSLAVTALWLKTSRGFPIDLPTLADGAWAWHKFFGSWSLFVLLYMGVTGPLTLFMPIVTKKLTPKLPMGGSLGAEAFVLSPSEAVSRLPAGAVAVRVQARASRHRAWYEFQLADGSRRAVSALNGNEVPVFLSSEELETEAREWLAGTSWTPKPGAVLLESHDSHYRDFQDAEVPVYKLELDGPGGLRVYLSARDGRLTASTMAVRSRLSRILGTFVKSVHALECGPFARHPNLRRAAMIFLLTLPVALTVIFGLWARFT